MLAKQLTRHWNHAKAAKAALQVKLAKNDVARIAAQRHLADRLGRMHGLPQKVGQMLSFSWNEQSQSELAPLRESGEALPLKALLPRLHAHWSRPVDEVIQQIEPHGLAASIGQVHRATLVDGREVAIKIQYPGIRDAIQSDLKLLGWLSLPMGGLSRGFDLSAYQKSLLDNLEAELDYTIEATTQSHLRQIAQQGLWIEIPAPIFRWSTKEILVTEWIEARPWDVAHLELSNQHRVRLAKDLLTFFLVGLLEQGMMQADWHPGNVRLRFTQEGPRWVLYDFGAPVRLEQEQRVNLRRLLAAPPGEDEAWETLVLLGFDPKWLGALRPKLPELCALLFEPFHATGTYSIANWRLTERMKTLLGEDRWNFRIAAPPALLPLMRAFHGLIYYLSKLAVPIDWAKALDEVSLATRAKQLGSQPSPSSASLNQPKTIAESLKIRVERGGETIVLLTFPANCATRIATLIDDELAARIQSQGIDLDAVSQSRQVRDLQPSELFSLVESDRTVKVWLA